MQKFKYNNVVYQILCTRFYQITGKHVDGWIKSKLKTKGRMKWTKDGSGTPLGPRGLMLDPDSAASIAELAIATLKMPYPNIGTRAAKKNWIEATRKWKADLPKEIALHYYLGWWIVISKKTKRPIVAYARGFMAQHLCIDISGNHLSPAVQLREEFWLPPSEHEEHFVERYVEAVLKLAV